jgi:hypothetical protein
MEGLYRPRLGFNPLDDEQACVRLRRKEHPQATRAQGHWFQGEHESRLRIV